MVNTGNKKLYDVIVAGVGSMGAAACYYLAERGHKVLGLEQFDIPHEHGSHTGQSRIIRKAYFEHPDYVPLLQRAYDNWSRLEQAAGVQLFHRTGLLYFGQKETDLMAGVRESSRRYHIPIHDLTGAEATDRFPQFEVPKSYDAIFEPDAGFVLPEKSIAVCYELALRRGAEIHTREGVISWEKKGDDMLVTTEKGQYTAKKLIIAAGGWAGRLIPALNDKLTVTRQTVAWVKPKNWDLFTQRQFPTWVIADPDYPGIFYGFPILSTVNHQGPAGLKIAHHTPGQKTDPDNLNPEIPEGDVGNILYALRKYLPEGYETILTLKTCLYTNSLDEHFIIDHLPGYDRSVAVAAGFSGHGFKFAPMVGEALADLAMEGKSELPIDFLSIARLLPR